MLLRQALASSLNIPAVQALHEIGLDDGLGVDAGYGVADLCAG